MITTPNNQTPFTARPGERGAALATSILMLAMLSAITLTVLAVVNTDTKIARADLVKTRAFYAAASGIEKMASDFNTLHARTSRPTTTQLNNIAAQPPDLSGEGFSFTQSIALDTATLDTMRATQGITSTAYPTVTVGSGPLVGMTASVAPYTLVTTATSSEAQVSLTRQMNNYLVPIFQFGMFSSTDMEMYPGPQFTFNGRVHANGNLYLNGNMTFLDKVTTASEVVRDVLRNGAGHDGTVNFDSGPLAIGAASVFDGPNVGGSYPNSPVGTKNTGWKSTSVAAFNGQLLSRETGIARLLLPLQLDGNQTREIIKRRMPNDDVTLSDSRYHSKAAIRILIDDENPVGGTDVSAIPTTQGVLLSTFNPIPLPNAAIASNGGRALWIVPDSGGTSYTTTSSNCILQELAAPSPAPTPTPTQAITVRGVRSTTQNVTYNGNNTRIPAGAGISGRILIQIVDSTGTTRDVTTQILSMGVTEGEPNAIIHLQRPLWAAYTQGTRDAEGGNSYLKYITENYWGADGEITSPTQDSNGYISGVTNDSSRNRAMTPPSSGWNSVVPINLYNVREGRINTNLAANSIYERGMTSIVEINMRNLARWLDGVYDQNLLAGTGAVSANIARPDGFIVYVSDRRGDKIKSEVDSSGATVNSTNGLVDNEDIYGASGVPNGQLDPGEDVIDFGAKAGTLQKDTTELPDPAASILGSTTASSLAELTTRADLINAWSNIDAADTANPKTRSKYFRRAVRLYDGEDLMLAGGTNQLSSTLGITVASENMVYIWGNYNTTGINEAPPDGESCLNDPDGPCYYLGDQVPASIVCDAFFPLSKTWFDSISALFPDDLGDRPADRDLPGVTSETSVRAGIIAGNNMSALSAGAGGNDAGNYSTDNNANESRLNGGMHNFPRFLENWGSRRYNFVGSLIPLYHSTQAMGQYHSGSTIYSPPARNWAFDATFRQPDKLPPGTPQFQYIESTAFRQSQ
jgi:Tfp pilus assembly protein PilX